MNRLLEEKIKRLMDEKMAKIRLKMLKQQEELNAVVIKKVGPVKSYI